MNIIPIYYVIKIIGIVDYGIVRQDLQIHTFGIIRLQQTFE
jgi:hypothetical protein